MQIKKYCCGAGTLFKIVEFIYEKVAVVEGLRSEALVTWQLLLMCH